MSNTKKKGSSVERVLQIVEVLASSQRPMSVSDLAEILEVPVPSMYRLLDQLQGLGFVQLDLPGKVTCGKRTYKLAMNLLQNSDFKNERLAILNELSAQIGETVGISILQDLDVVYIDRVMSDWPLQIFLPSGTHVPVWASASGKLLLAQLADEKCERIVEKMSIHALTTKTQTDKKQLMQTISATRETGVGIDDEEFIPGMVACAVMIPNGDQQAFATVFTHGPTVRKSLEELLSYVPLMQEAANELSVIFNQNYE
ncbi:IclR family transcriptional regulator [Psychrobacter sp. K31L]|uniref:IclR family transcriptional regulator n=1 Tax=Psychrobacter sp. K31L TaxID=2820758 RepID=UPI001B31DB4D|nr:IclR family transcriptional regulator [Psychrobacter sp. K31L]MBP3944675.1 IclR family transcriptional regulator [Psychrobacter sp. K31L]